MLVTEEGGRGRGRRSRHLDLSVILVWPVAFSLLKCTKYDTSQLFNICAHSDSISISSLLELTLV